MGEEKLPLTKSRASTAESGDGMACYYAIFVLQVW